MSYTLELKPIVKSALWADNVLKAQKIKVLLVKWDISVL